MKLVTKKGEYYYIASYDKDSDWCEEYSMLKGPNEFTCCLTEPEDRTWYRDGRDVVNELNRLYAIIIQLQNEVLRLETTIEEY